MLEVLLEGLAPRVPGLRLGRRGPGRHGRRRDCGGPGPPTGPARSTTCANGPRARPPGRRPASATPGGPPTAARREENAHPHLDCSGRLAVVHNGIIENHVELAEELVAAGHHLESDTDTEVLAHLVEDGLRRRPGRRLAGAVRAALGRVRGASRWRWSTPTSPTLIVAARRISPLLMGVSDTAGLPRLGRAGPPRAHPRASSCSRTIRSPSCARDRSAVTAPRRHRRSSRSGSHVDWDLEAARKDGYDDFMSKEIHEQPKAVADTLLDRLLPDGTLALDEIRITNDELRAVDKVFIVACGSSYHAGLMAKYAIEHWARLPAEIDIASEFRYRDPVLDDADARHRGEPVGRDGRHLPGHPRGPPPGGQGAGHLQRGRLVHGPGGRRRALHAGRARDRRGLHQDPPGPDHRPRDPGPLPGPGPGDARTRRRPGAARGHGRPPRQGGHWPSSGRPTSRRSPAGTGTRRRSSSSAATSATRWRSKGRSS